MDSQAQPQLPALVVRSEAGAMPLKNAKYERFAVLRAAMFGRVEAGREAGLTDNRENLNKIERKPNVSARIAYLCRDTASAVKAIRDKVTQKLNVVADVSMADYIRMEKDPSAIREAEKLMDPAKRQAAIDALPILPWLDLTRIASLAPEEQREILSAVKSVSYTEHGPKFEIHSPLDAIAQLRKMSGLDAAENLNIKGDLTLEALVRASYNGTEQRQEPKQVEHDSDEKVQE